MFDARFDDEVVIIWNKFKPSFKTRKHVKIKKVAEIFRLQVDHVAGNWNYICVDSSPRMAEVRLGVFFECKPKN